MNRIKELRKDRNVTVKDLSEKFGVSQSMLTNYENGSSLPRDNEIWNKLADYFEVSVPYVMGLTSRPSDYIKAPVQRNPDKLFEGMKPLEIAISSWDEFQVLNFLENLDAEDLKKTVKFMYGLLQDNKYDDKEIAREYIFKADSLTVDRKTNNAKLENMRMEAVKEKRSDKNG
ncbi:transcriptional regulator with XRE-family HTH domain [Enterococcus sp. PF1-24]|uniref:helix-turn-helix domain-containing protein n=1 Tax=unclassified Enterococcus TaxID=2608891 RepID=UPI002476F773|nr:MULTISPECIES: helix-turn-helix transcriptional regulator [unclassified Enterococcus]MDH6363471.1 transcriptional regulator with XRE-family HTH domain [Enterococcus sp. PFB1-1]MDH6400565.1 transcriptional regulator with XRE-family HTH domain [Enterococcus sp. PF1-24]